jgi:ABC-type sugar transport system ATPase subunit
MPEGSSPILELKGISKTFGGVEALRGVDFALSAGEIHGLVGENGAGKSTLMKIIAGVHPEFSGRLLLDGQEKRFRSARDAHAAGIAMVHQELSVAPDLTVAENVFLGNQPTNAFGLVQWRRMAREAGEQLARFGIDVDPLSRLGDLPIGLQQLIEIARVLSRARASSFWTSRPRRYRRPRWSACSRHCGGCARKARRSSSSRISSRTFCAFPTPSRCFAMAGKSRRRLPRRPARAR